jgi:hypothetical protein
VPVDSTDDETRGPDADARPAGSRSVPGARSRSSAVLGLLHNTLPCIVGLPVLSGIAVTLWRLSSTRYPYLGWAHTVASDAKAVSLGDWIYGDPAESYTGMLYTPLYPTLVGGLYRLMWWDGWPIAVSTLAGLTTAGVVGWIAVGPIGAMRWPERARQLAGGVGLAGTAWWFVSLNYRNLLYDGRADQLAWRFALVGLVLVVRGVQRRPQRMWPAVLVLSAALWTKQTTVGATLAAGAAMGWWFLQGAVPVRTLCRFLAGFVLVNVVILVAVEALSRGWGVYFMFTLPGRHQRNPAIVPFLRELRDLLVWPSVILAIAAVGLYTSTGVRRALAKIPLVVRGARLGPRRSRTTTAESAGLLSFAPAVAILLALFLLFSFVPAFAGRRKQGGEPNQYIGMIWAVGLLVALVHRSAMRRPRQMAAGTLAYLVLVASVHVAPLRSVVEEHAVPLATSYPAIRFVGVPVALRDYARTHEIYTPFDADMSSQFTRRVWPLQPNIVDLLAAGEQPMYLVDALIERVFDAVLYFDTSADAYASRFGEAEEAYLWKLNQVIDHGYVLDASLGLLVRRTEAVDLSWMRQCFAPFELSGTTWRIGRGGGLWCQQTAESVRLHATPAPVTEIFSEALENPRATINARLPSGHGWFEVRVENAKGSWLLRVTARDGGTFDLMATDNLGNTTLTPGHVAAEGRIRISVGEAEGSGAVVLLPAGVSRLVIAASGDSAVEVAADITSG